MLVPVMDIDGKAPLMRAKRTRAMRQWGDCIVGGTPRGRISLHGQEPDKRLCQNTHPEDIAFLAYNERSQRFLPSRDGGVFTLGS